MNTRSKSHTDNQTNFEMEQEENYIHSYSSYLNNVIEENNNINLIELDVDNIQNETIIDNSGFTYYPEKYKICFLPQNDLAKEITLNTLKIMLIKIKIKVNKDKIKDSDEVFVINKLWYEKWKRYSRYGTLKRIMKIYHMYENNPIKFKPNEKMNPGEINNKEIMIRYRINDNDGRNILVSKYNDSLDTRKNMKKDLKIIEKLRFNLLKDFYKCDHILKGRKIYENDSKLYGAFSVHLNIIFIPTLEAFKELKEENYEEFKKKHDIIYDIYFKQSSTRNEVLNELKNIYKEKPEIISNMGVKFSSKEINEDELLDHIELLKYYKPSFENKKTPKEILDYILTKETIEKIKKGEKIKSNEIELNKIDQTNFELRNLFGLSRFFKEDNIDEVENGLILVEYIPTDKNKEKKEYIKESKSIFEKINF